MKVAEATSGGEEGKVVAGRKRGGGEGERAVRKRGCGRRTRRRVQAASSAIQRLFSACRTVFKGVGTVPVAADVQMLRHILDKMGPHDVGLSMNIPFFMAEYVHEGTPRITYTTIYSDEYFSLCIFFLPPSAVIPLHNHPGMTVFSKLLLGSMHIESYDWVDPSTSSDSATPSHLRLAKLVVDSDFCAPCDTCILYPTSGGNMHTFRAITACAVLDVLGPPYSKEDDRDCTYYRQHPYSHHSDVASPRAGSQIDQLRWLEEIDMPKDLKMDYVDYHGPQPTVFDDEQ